MAFDLRGRVALITGVSRRVGIGTAIARAFAEAGCGVFTTYFHPNDAGLVRQPARGHYYDLNYPRLRPLQRDLRRAPTAQHFEKYSAATDYGL